MVHLKRLLAATDLSAPARRAVERAALVAKESGATLDLTHVASLAPLEKLRRLLAGMPANLEERVLDAAREGVNELAAAILRDHGVAASVHVASGPLLAELASRAATLSADLVILGARGASFMRHLVLGSTAERMVRSATRPMLVVKQAAHERYRNVLVPVDFSPSSRSALRVARSIAPGAAIVLLHAYEVPLEGKLRFAGVDEKTVDRYRAAARDDARQKLQALCEEAGLSPHGAALLVVHGDAALQIIEQEQERDCDLIVMGKHGESMVEELLLGSVTRQVLAQSEADVLVSV